MDVDDLLAFELEVYGTGRQVTMNTHRPSLLEHYLQEDQMPVKQNPLEYWKVCILATPVCVILQSLTSILDHFNPLSEPRKDGTGHAGHLHNICSIQVHILQRL